MTMQASKGRQPDNVSAYLKPMQIIGTSVLVISMLFSFSSQAKNNNENDYDLQPIEELGKRLFFENISDPNRMSCATCHAPNTGGTYNVSGVNLHQVAVTGARPHLRPQDLEEGQEKTTVKNAGGLKPPTNQYVSFLYDGVAKGLQKLQLAGQGPCGIFPCGGAFWNGRANGDIVENTNLVFDVNDASWQKKTLYAKYLGSLADQAFASPFLNPVEQNHKSKEDVCSQVESTKWGKELYYLSWGVGLSCQSAAESATAFARFSVALAAWQMSEDNNRFNSKRDIALAEDDNQQFPLAGFTDLENEGHDLFYGQAGCVICHNSNGANGTHPLERYTDDSYHAIGVPRNYELPGSPLPDIGLHPTLLDLGLNPNANLPFPPFNVQNAFIGAHKTPTLRNVDKRPGKGFTKAYAHNGWFKSLESIVHFYNTSDVDGQTAADFGVIRCPASIVTEKEALANNCWPAPEVPDAPLLTIGAVTGDLGLTAHEEAALVAYMKTLTDTTTVEPPKPYKSTSNPPKKGKK
ncbi:methylamine utilization protein [Photobacterium sp. CAU 1568]|uniref:Methylamine utilization protein n=1 Tax=Photobacterium arenosum TaxID=2774143 RepID=A0ABR9BFS4_9GAMM|nr:cytochrome c peroxidase [Photobacterium arenosum]MBD8511410.1 methylamine utilization protein [Photobacterium arenosum]